MTDYITRDELDEAIKSVHERITETEDKLRAEFTGTLRWEMGQVNSHLADQDETLKWINRWALGGLVSVIVALVLLIH